LCNKSNTHLTEKPTLELNPDPGKAIVLKNRPTKDIAAALQKCGAVSLCACCNSPGLLFYTKGKKRGFDCMMRQCNCDTFTYIFIHPLNTTPWQKQRRQLPKRPPKKVYPKKR
jgi:hypothetical protein